MAEYSDDRMLLIAGRIAEVHRLVQEARSKVSASKQPDVWGPLDRADTALQELSIPFLRVRARGRNVHTQDDEGGGTWS